MRKDQIFDLARLPIPAIYTLYRKILNKFLSNIYNSTFMGKSQYALEVAKLSCS